MEKFMINKLCLYIQQDTATGALSLQVLPTVK